MTLFSGVWILLYFFYFFEVTLKVTSEKVYLFVVFLCFIHSSGAV